MWTHILRHSQFRKSAGQGVLIHGAAGGVGSFAVQLVRRQGAHGIATVSAANTDFVQAIGADDVIDYLRTPFETLVGDVDVPNRNQLVDISRLIDAGIIRPVVGAVNSMENVRQAYEQKPVRGKNVLLIVEERMETKNKRTQECAK